MVETVDILSEVLGETEAATIQNHINTKIVKLTD